MQMQIKTQYAFLMSNHQQKGSVSLAPYNEKAHAIPAADTPISQSRRPREESGFARLDISLEPSTSQFRCHAPRVSCAEPRGGGLSSAPLFMIRATLLTREGPPRQRISRDTSSTEWSR